MDSENPETKYAEIFKQNGITDEISKITISKALDLLGEQFGSIIEYVTIEFKDRDREDCHLFVKKIIPTPDSTQKDIFEKVMVGEGFFLTNLVNDMKQLCIERVGLASFITLKIQTL